MSHKFPNVFVIIILCLVVIFISGILLPKYLSDQYFQVRSDLNSQKGASKYILQRNTNPNATKQSHSGKENISRSSENAEIVENIQSVSNLPESHANPVPAPAKVKKRSKRQAVSKGEELFSWRFNFSLARHQDTHFTESSKDALDKSDDENMGIALNAKGKGDKQTVSGDIQNALKSMKMFFNTLLDKNTATIDHKSDDKVMDIHEETSVGVPVEQTQHTDLDHTDVDEFSLKKREGKFIFGNLNIFGFGRKSLDKSTAFPEISSSSTETDLSTPKPVEITLENVESVEKELLQEAQIFHAESPASESLDLGVIATISNISDSATDVIVDHNLCLDCPEESPLSKFTSEADNLEDASKITFRATKPAFTDDVLEKFCLSHLNKVSESQHSSDPEDGHGFETVHDTINERNLRSSLNNSQFDLSTELDTVNEFGSESDVIEDSFVVSKDELPESDLTRQSKFINFGNLFGLGSGRSAVLESDQFNALASENVEDPVDMENLPSILDCESYFRTKHSTKFMFPKPNLMDMISDPKIQLTDFDNGTMSGKLKEQNLMFLTGLLKTTINDSVDTTDDSDKFRAKGIENVSEGDKNEDENTESIEMFTGEIDEVVEKHGTEFDENALNLTDNQRDSRFINLFGFGSGSNEGNQRSDERFFLGSLFGSGSRSFDALDSANESDGNDIGSGGAFNKISDTLSSGNLENQLETSSAFSIQERQFQGLEFSGDGRQLPEDDITEIFDDKCDDCFYEENTTELSVDCHENDCDFGNNVLKNDTLQKTHENCSCVHDTSTKNISFDECDECSFNPADLSNESNYSDGYPSEEILEDTQLHENVNEWDECDDCAHSNLSSKETFMSEGNDSFSECDDCSFNVADTAENIKENDEKNMTFSDCDTCHFNDSNTYDESYEAVDTMSVSKDNNQTNMREGNEDACDDCGQENDTKQPNEKPSLHNTDEFLKELTTIKDSESSESTIQLRAGIIGVDTDQSIIENTGESSLDEQTTGDTEQSKIENTGESSLDEQTTGNDGRFIGTIFLTGSGDGGLFGDSGGPINLFEEESTIVVPDKSSRRRARLDDTFIDPFEMFTHEVLEQNSMRTRNPNEETTITVKVPISRRRGRLDDSLENNLKPQQNSKREHWNINVETNGTSKDIFISKVTDVPTVTSIKSFNVNEVFTSRHPNFCNSAMECNAALNEFCIKIESSGICGCRRGYVRHKESGECVVKRVVETSIKLPAEKFDNDLKDPSSTRYQQMRNESITVMWSLIHKSPDLMSVTTEIDVIGFSPGSLIVDYRLVFAVKNETEADLMKEVEKDIVEGLKDEKLMENIPLDVSNAALISVNHAVNPCKSKDLNYCSPNAYCIWNEVLPERFTCYCKDHYRDASDNPRNVGETCIAKCPSDYCGPYGHCENLENNERYCLCTGWYFGKRCEVPGIYVLIVMAIVAFISIIALFVVVFRKRCTSRGSYRGTNVDMQFGNGKVEEATALNSNTGIPTKFMHISTPMPPVIKVIHPSIHESSLSFEYDSTFDRTPDSEDLRSSETSDSKKLNGENIVEMQTFVVQNKETATDNQSTASPVAETVAVEIPPDEPQSQDEHGRSVDRNNSYII